jgi:hypothetical protein
MCNSRASRVVTLALSWVKEDTAEKEKKRE